MKRAGYKPLAVLVAMLLCAGCGDETGICDPGEGTCLGGCPTFAVNDLTVPDQPSDWGTSHSPWVSGTPIGIPPGGWLVESSPAVSGSDVLARRLVRLDPRGDAAWVDDAETNTSVLNPTNPEPFAMMNDTLVLAAYSCPERESCDTDTDFKGSLVGRTWDNATTWTLSSAQLGFPDEMTLLDTGAGDAIWVLLSSYVPFTLDHTNRMARIARDGTIVGEWPLLNVGAPQAYVADENGFLIIYRRITDDGTSRTLYIDAAYVGRDGTVANTTEVASFDVTVGHGDVDIGFHPIESGIVVATKAQTTGSATSSYRTFLVNVDTTKRWTHEGPWADGLGFAAWNCHETADGSIYGLSNADSEPRIYRPDGHGYDAIAMPTASPFGDNRDWFIGDWYFLDDGILIMAWAQKDAGTFDGAVAMYDAGFTTMKWARKYVESCTQAPALTRGPSGWIVSCQGTRTWPGFYSNEAPTATYLHFDSICQP